MSIEDTINQSPDAKPMCGYPVSPRKFWLMMILTARIYAVYWAYKNFLALDKTPATRPQILAGFIQMRKSMRKGKMANDTI